MRFFSINACGPLREDREGFGCSARSVASKTVTTPCVLCGGERFEEYCPGILRCSGCTLVFADAELTDQEMLDLYGREYFVGEEYGDYLGDRRVHERNFRRRLSTLEKFLDPSRRGSLLEIGSAYGFFLDLARERFDTVAGIDVNREGVEFARETLGLQATRGEFLEHDLEGRTFDVVCLWDVMEHLRSPHRYLEKISAHSRPGSLIALTTGDVGSLNARWRGGKWRLIHPPTHLFYFSRRTIAALLEKHGYEVLSSSHCGVSRSVDNIFWTVAASKGRLPGLYRAMKKAGLLDWSVYLNLFDILYVIARKK
jgi:SAM-dependent methyltransferase